MMNISSKLLFNLLTFSFLLLLACDKGDENKRRALGENNMSNVNEQNFQLSPEQLKELIDRVKTLKLGENRASVIEIMGTPDDEELIGPKRGGVVEWPCRGLVYYITFNGRMSGRNERITLVFDGRQDKLIRILSAIEELRQGGMVVCS